MNRLLVSILCFLAALSIGQPYSSVYANDEISIQSESAIVMDAKSGDVLYEKNANEQMYPASITKIATAIYAIENGNLNDLVTVSERARNADGTRVYLEEGEVVTLDKLIKGMVINSGNDAAIAIAEHLNGSVEAFSDEINDYLKEVIGVTDTHFVNPSGLFDENHQTTAYDMAQITQYAMQNQTFRQIFQMKELPWDGESWDTTIINHHKLLIDSSFPYVTGGKTGFVSESGHTLVTTAKNDWIDVIVVTLKAESSRIAYNDTISLLNYSLNGFETVSIEAGTKYEVNMDQQYELKDELSYTKKRQEVIEELIDESGELSIIGEGERLIKKIALSIVEKEDEKPVEQTVKANGLTGQYSIVLMLSFAMALFLTGYFFLDVRKM